MLFSLFSLNSLYPLLPGIVFDTRENGGLLFVFFYSLLLLGIVFDTCVCVELPFVGLLLPFECRVSFSIPVLAWVRSSCVMGIVFDTYEYGYSVGN